MLIVLDGCHFISPTLPPGRVQQIRGSSSSAQHVEMISVLLLLSFETKHTLHYALDPLGQ